MKQIITLTLTLCLYFCRWRPECALFPACSSMFCCTPSASLGYALFDSLYGMPIPDVERTSASFWLLYWSQYCDMPSIKGVSTVDRKPGASTDVGIYNVWRSDMWVCMICLDMHDADRCRACMRASVGMQVLQYRYCNNSGSLTPLPCRVVNHWLVVQVLVRTEG